MIYIDIKRGELIVSWDWIRELWISYLTLDTSYAISLIKTSLGKRINPVLQTTEEKECKRRRIAFRAETRKSRRTSLKTGTKRHERTRDKSSRQGEPRGKEAIVAIVETGAMPQETD